MDENHINNDSIINETFRTLNERHNNIYQFVMRYNDYIVSTHDYGIGILLNMIEAHTLTYIEENPGITITELAAYWNKTKGALSQTVSQLCKKGLVTKEKKEGNAKNVLLYATETGIELSKAHKLYDTLDITKTMGELKKECSPDEIDAFYKVISVYNKIIQKDFEINRGKRKKKPAPNKVLK
ncbi:MAG: MarR family transcriptional regulator [Lachnospiraceae bacterium]|jgi:DNA-binding MarR family transcriptional regulator|nr:MarR family transcriptional regulator [Lachnospiraceae bacterium]